MTDNNGGVRAVAGAFLLFLYSFLYDYIFFQTGGSWDLAVPGFASLMSGLGALVQVVLAVVVVRRPDVLHARMFAAASTALLAAGGLGLVLGETLGIRSCLDLGAILVDISFDWAFIVTCLALSRMGPDGLLRTVCACAAAAFALSSLLQGLSMAWAVAVFVACPALMLLFCNRLASPLIESSTDELPAAQISVTQPFTMVPFSSPIFVSMLVFMMAFGYSWTSFGKTGLVTSLVTLAFVAAVALVVTRGARSDLNLMYQLASVLLLFGLSLVPAREGAVSVLSDVTVRASSVVFYALQTAVLASLLKRNSSNGVYVASWGNAIGMFGMTCGGLIGAATFALGLGGGPAVVVNSLVSSLFAAYLIVGLRGFDFARSILEIHEPEGEVEAVSPDIATLCSFATARYKLTPRESEVLECLARGRNCSYIEEHLTISRNTVRTHVRHIYEKIGCHSQQELISAVEALSGEGARPS